MIEHLSPDAARGFLEEQWRVLGSGGIIRVVCPDLAEIAHISLNTIGHWWAAFRHFNTSITLQNSLTKWFELNPEVGWHSFGKKQPHSNWNGSCNEPGMFLKRKKMMGNALGVVISRKHATR